MDGVSSKKVESATLYRAAAGNETRRRRFFKTANLSVMSQMSGLQHWPLLANLKRKSKASAYRGHRSRLLGSIERDCVMRSCLVVWSLFVLAASAVDGQALVDDPFAEEYHIAVVDRQVLKDDPFVREYRVDSEICQAKYSCKSTDEQRRGLGRECSCHVHCHLFGTCCHDNTGAAYHDRVPRRYYTCNTDLVEDGCLSDKGIILVNECPQRDADTRTAALCRHPLEKAKNSADSLSTPVTDKVSGVTYRNIHCATCWNTAPDNAISWDWRFSCSGMAQRDRAELIGQNDDVSEEVARNRSLVELRDFILSSRETCFLSYEPPQSLKNKLHECRPKLREDCAPEADEAARQACLGNATRYSYSSGAVYKSPDCASCSGAATEPIMTCQIPHSESCSLVGQSFSLLLSPYSNDCPFGGTPVADNLALPGVCGSMLPCMFSRSGDAGLPKECSFLCPVGGLDGDDECRTSSSNRVCHFGMDVRDLPDSATSNIVNGTLFVEINDTLAACFPCEVRRYKNFTVQDDILLVEDAEYPSFGRLFYTTKSDLATACVLKTFDAGGRCNQLPDVVTTSLLVTSEASLVLFFVGYALASNLRRFPGDMTANEACALFLGYLLFLLRPVAEPWPALCTTFAVGIHYFLTAAFVWMALYALEVLRALSFQYGDSKRNRRRIAYYAVGWGLPLTVVAAALMADHLEAAFRPAYGLPQCFIGSRLGNRVFFMAPLCCFVLVSMVSFAYMIVKLAIVARQTRAVRRRHHEKLAISVKLFFSLGLLWTFAVLASFVDRPWLVCAFTVLNASQGLFLLFAFTFNRETLRRLTVLARNLSASVRATASTFGITASTSRTTTSTVAITTDSTAARATPAKAAEA